MKEVVENLIRDLLKESFSLEGIPFKVEKPKRDALGDLATNVAFLLARELKKNPKDIAQELAQRLSEDPRFSQVQPAGGFVNFFFSKDFLVEEFKKLLKSGEKYFKENLGRGKKVQLEFVSANPTGPLHLGHGRGAVVGDTLARLMEFFGYDVTREYYINDAGRQVYLLGVSIYIQYLRLFGEKSEELERIYEEEGYKGEYIKELAQKLKDLVGDLLLKGEVKKAQELIRNSEYGKEYTKREAKNEVELCTLFGLDLMMEEIREDLESLGIGFDVWFSERDLYEKGEVERLLGELEEKGYLYPSEGALWLRTSEFGDDKDRVVRKSDGSYTYFASDIAYHWDKFKRGFDKVINLWGADHHGYIPRVKAALKMLGVPEDWLEIYLVQIVKLFRGGKEVKMSKRAGNFVTLRELIDEVGSDAVRFVFLTKRSDTPLDFDVDAVKEKSSENPVFYVQYAHARICGVFREAKERGYVDPEKEDLEGYLNLLTKEEELKLMKMCLMMKDELREVTLSRDPHLITYNLTDLASVFHRYYNHNRIINPDRELMLARLALLKGIKETLALSLKLIGVSAPERM